MNASGERRVDLGRSHLLTGQLLDHGLSRLAGDAADVGHGLVAQAADAGLGLIHLGLKTGVFGLLAARSASTGLKALRACAPPPLAAVAAVEAMRRQFDEARKCLDRRFEDKVDKLQRGDELPPGVL